MLALLKEGVDDVLFLSHVLFSFFEAIDLAFDVDNSTMMQDSIEDGRSNGHVGEDLVPLREGFIRCKDSGRFLVTSGDKLKE